MNLLIKYATRGRRKLFTEAITNIHSTISDQTKFRIIVSADEDDETMLHLPLPIKYGPHVSKVHAINRDMEGEKFDWLINMSDDMRFVEKDWDLLMLQQIRHKWGKSTDWFAHFNDGFVGSALPTMSIMGYDYYKRDEYIYHPSYNSVSCDAEAMFVAQMRGKYHYFPEMYFNHFHPANTKMAKHDDTYMGNDKFDVGDTANYFARMRKGFDVVDPVMIPNEVKLKMNEA